MAASIKSFIHLNASKFNALSFKAFQTLLYDNVLYSFTFMLPFSLRCKLKTILNKTGNSSDSCHFGPISTQKLAVL